MKTEKFARSLSLFNPFGEILISLPPSNYYFLDHPCESRLNLKDAKKLYRNLGTAIRQHEREQKKLVRNFIKTDPFKQLLNGGVFKSSPEIRGVK
jgi:hypothetical protein